MRELNKPPGNARIAAALIEALAANGDSARRARVEQLLGDEAALRRRRADWIQPELLHALFREAAVKAPMARNIGRSLVGASRIGLLLCYAGIATPEKAYRRAEQLLARERPGDRFAPTEIAQGRAHVDFHPKTPCAEDAIFCAVRIGMLEAITTVYGLLPARVTETECAHRGGEKCTFEICWGAVPRTWLAVGGLCGLAAGVGLGLGVGLVLGSGTLPVVGITVASALGLGLLGASLGRSLDLSRQLTAVAGAGLGQLALVDQLDGVFAEKMDALAKLDRLPEEARTRGGSRGPAPIHSEDGAASQSVAPGLLRRFNSALAVIQNAHSRMSGAGVEAVDELALCEEASRELRAIGVAFSEDAEAAGDEGEVADLIDVVRRGIGAVCPGQPDTLEISLSLAADAAPIRCHPFQLEQVVIQLLMNAAEAVRGNGRIDAAVRPCADGFELSISDEGEGIDPEILDGLFDPFFASTAAGAESGLGLTLCYSVVDRHGGELSVQSEPGHGTRVAVVLPAQWEELPA